MASRDRSSRRDGGGGGGVGGRLTRGGQGPLEMEEGPVRTSKAGQCKGLNTSSQIPWAQSSRPLLAATWVREIELSPPKSSQYC